MNNHDDEDLDIFEDKSSFWKKTYVFKVYKTFGIMHLMIALLLVFCYISILLPAFAKYGYESLDKFITFLSKGDQTWADIYWGFFIASIAGIIIVYITIKICDRVYGIEKKKKENEILDLYE